MIVSYELNIIHQVVQGSLSPLYFPTEPSEQARFYNHLSEVPQTCARQIHARFRQSEDQSLSIEFLDIRLLDRYRPPIFIVLNHEVQVYDVHAGEVLLDLVLKRLSLASDSVFEWYHWQDESGSVHLELYAYYPLDSLSFEERRYHFYQKLLIEQVAMVQQRMLQYIHQVPSRKKAQKYVQDHQQTLITYAGQLLAYLDDEEEKVYGFSGEYNLPDVFKLIFLSIEELILFIEQKFVQYLDMHGYISYHNSLISKTELLKKYNAIQAALLQSSSSEDLLSVLHEAFLKFESIKPAQITYLELMYLKKLLEELETVTKKEKVNDFQIASALYQLNFNSPAFLAYIMRCLDSKLEEKMLVSERLDVLYHYRKLSKQLAPKTRHAFKPGYATLEGQINNYIEEDIQRYQQELKANVPVPLSVISSPVDRILEREVSKIPTKLSVRQWAYLIRLFFEVKLFPEGNKAAVFRLFNQVLSTTHKKDLAEGSLYNRQYEADARTQEVVREKLQEMINFIRKDKPK
jgi:hypothetical protein